MRLIKKVIFWLHLVAGLSAGLVILVMAATGLTMSFERQILEATSGISVKPENRSSLGPEAILAAQAGSMPAASAVIYNEEPTKPLVVQFGRGKSVFVDPYTGQSLGEGNPRTKKFFAWVLTVHRWLALEGEGRDVGKGVTGAANMVFLFLVLSGLWLWFPKRWTKSGLRAITRLQWRLKGRARDWNWHNVFGFWACLPLFVIVTTGAIMSYGWANNLIFRAVGESPPPPKQSGPPGGGAEGGGREGGMNREGRERREPRAEGEARLEDGERRGPRAEGERREGGERRREGGGERRREGGGPREGGTSAEPVSLKGLDAGFALVKPLMRDWQTIQVSPQRGATAQFTISSSHRGRPDLRRQITVDLTNSQLVKNEGMESQTPGRQVRTWVRWIHTGEAFGWVGQLVMAVATVSALVLIYTGFALSWRRFFRRRKINSIRGEASEEIA